MTARTFLPLLVLLGAVPLVAAQEEARPPEVRLLVLVVVDQLTQHQLDRLAPHLEGGLGRFLGGEVHHDAWHAHAGTSTGPGHAALGTGVHPSRSGIVGNAWNDRLAGDALTYCSSDPEAGPLRSGGAEPASGAGRSGATLLVDGFAEHLRAASPGARVVGIAGKDRAATLGTGRRADLALWWDRSTGSGFESSTAYGAELPAWVRAWNERWWEGLSGYRWEDLVGPELARAGTAPDVHPGERPAAFPHVAPAEWPEGGEPNDAARVALARFSYGSPLVDRFVVDLALRALDAEALGQRDAVDLLLVGLSACDVVGHAHGPASREVTSLLLETDRALGELLDAIDARVGPGRWIAALSSDHGVLPLPERLADRGVDATRLDPRAYDRALRVLGEELEALLGDGVVRDLGGADGVLLDRARLAEAGVEAASVGEIASAVLAAELPRFRRCFTWAELGGPAAGAEDPLLAAFQRSWHPDRGADLVICLEPWTLLGSDIGTGHGTPWPYDRAVPLAFLGPGSRTGAHFTPVHTVDVLPTLLARAGLAVPQGLDGRVIE